MDGSRFDNLVKSLGAGRSRRSVLGALAGAALAAVGAGSAEAANKRSVGNACATNNDCASGLCVQETRTRKICHCRSSGDCPAATAQCQTAACLPTGYCGTAITPGASCSDGNRCTTGDVCQGDGSCVGAPVICTSTNECWTAGSCQAADGQCSTETYHGDGAACSAGVCWSGACCAPEDQATTCAGTCGPQTDNCGQAVDCGPCCLAPEAACAGDNDCCSGICAAGICAAGPVLDGGACDSDTDCQNGHCCSGVCRNFKTDTSNCGFCGNVCSTNHLTGVACSDGLCVGTCDAGYADCDGNKLTNGCEVDLNTDHDNCGACGAICRVGETCVAGVCQCGANPRCDAHEACVNDVCFDACAPFTGGATNSAKCVTDCGETFGDSCIAGPESAICVAVYGTITCDPCDRDAECPGGYCMAWQYGSQLYKTNETCGVGASKGVCATFLYVCPEGGAV